MILKIKKSKSKEEKDNSILQSTEQNSNRKNRKFLLIKIIRNINQYPFPLCEQKLTRGKIKYLHDTTVETCIFWFKNFFSHE